MFEGAILTPPTPRRPRLNGPTVYGARPGSPFLYRLPATGEGPLTYEAEGLPRGLSLDPATGIITGATEEEGTHPVADRAGQARWTAASAGGDREISRSTPTARLQHRRGWEVYVNEQNIAIRRGR